jgi:hypothetical protein
MAAIIVGSGATIGAQVSAAAAFSVGRYAVVEIILDTSSLQRKLKRYCDCCTTGRGLTVGRS